MRGALGLALRAVACGPECSHTPACFYSRFFEGRVDIPRPSGFAQVPRPFVIRAEHLQGLLPAEPFSFTVNLFDLRHFDRALFLSALDLMARTGLGPDRVPCSLGDLSWQAHEFQLPPPGTAASEPLELDFRTPLELRSAGETVDLPEFPILIARLRDRIAALNVFYGDGPLDLDFARFTDTALSVLLISHDLSHRRGRRLSTRTGRWHPLDGIAGRAVYRGPWRAYENWLRLGEFTGVGRQTAFGKGAFRIVGSPADLSLEAWSLKDR